MCHRNKLWVQVALNFSVIYATRVVVFCDGGRKEGLKLRWAVGKNFQIWGAGTEAELQAKQVLDVVLEKLIGDGSAKPSQEVALKVAKVRAVIIRGIGQEPMCMCIGVKM